MGLIEKFGKFDRVAEPEEHVAHAAKHLVLAQPLGVLDGEHVKVDIVAAGGRWGTPVRATGLTHAKVLGEALRQDEDGVAGS